MGSVGFMDSLNYECMDCINCDALAFADLFGRFSMKRKLISTVIILSMLVGLTACSNESVSTDSGPSETTSSSTPSSKDSTSSTSSSADSASSGSLSTAPQISKWKDFIGADGQPVTLADATVDEMGRVSFDYSFIEYAPPIYDDTFKNPALINWETLEFAPHNDTYTTTVKRLKAGDVLENGLKVKEAVRILEYGTYIDQETLETRSEWVDYHGTVSFDGELTLSGALYCVPEEGYQVFEGELYFFPDTTSFSQLPVGCGFARAENEEYTGVENVFPDAKLAVVCSALYHLGNISETDCNGIIEKGKAAEVTVTIKNIRIETANINYGGRGGGIFAEIVSIEKINN